MVFGTQVCYRTRSFNGLPTRRDSTGAVCFVVVVVGAMRAAVVDICLIGELFLRAVIISIDGGCAGECAHYGSWNSRDGICLSVYRQRRTLLVFLSVNQNDGTDRER